MTKLISVEFNCCVKSRHTVFKPKHTSGLTQTHAQARSAKATSAPSRIPSRVFRSESYNIPPSTFLLGFSHVQPHSFPPHLTRAARPALTPPTSGAFSMALNAMPPYFIERFVGWCWSPPQCLAMNSCIRDVRCGRRLERVWKKLLGGRVFLSVLVSCIEVVVI